MTDTHYRQLAEAAAQPYRPVGRFAHGFARGKLTGDPIFEYVLRHGLISRAATILDLGCGQGVLTALIRAAQRANANGQWPADWAQAPVAVEVTGIELMQRDVDRGQRALGDAESFICGNIASTPFPAADAVVIFDVLHYLPYDSQNQILENVKRALEQSSHASASNNTNGRGLLLLRIGDADAGIGFHISQWTDRIVTWCRGHRMPPTFCRPLSQWQSDLESLGFDVDVVAMSEGTLFANVMLIARLRDRADV